MTAPGGLEETTQTCKGRGRGGQRCQRTALANGYCRMHQGQANKVHYAQRFSASLEMETGLEGHDTCPLCLAETIPVEQAVGLTLEHYPPKSCGGRATTLVCENCRRAWANIDNHLWRYHTQEVLKALARSIPSLRFDFYSEERHESAQGRHWVAGHVLIRPAQEHSAQTGQLLRELMRRSKPEGLKLRLRPGHEPGRGDLDLLVPKSLYYTEERVRLAILKAACLASFHALGYRYILSQVVEPIRGQFADLNLAFLKRAIYPQVRAEATRPLIRLSVAYEPAEARGLVVAFSGFGPGLDWVVYLPLPSAPGFPQYDLLPEAAGARRGEVDVCIFEPARRMIVHREITIIADDQSSFPLYDAAL